MPIAVSVGSPTFTPVYAVVGSGFDLFGVATGLVAGAGAPGSNLAAAAFGSAVGRAAERAGREIVSLPRLYCGKSLSARVLHSIETGALLGGILGGVGGFITGEAFGGELTLGATGLPGAALGVLVGALWGAMKGVEFGVLSAGVCKALGFYN